MNTVLVNLIFFFIGVALVAAGWRLLAHNSDQKVLSRFKSGLESRFSKEAATASRTLNLVIFGLFVMLIGFGLMIAGIVGVVGLGIE